MITFPSKGRVLHHFLIHTLLPIRNIFNIPMFRKQYPLDSAEIAAHRLWKMSRGLVFVQLWANATSILWQLFHVQTILCTGSFETLRTLAIWTTFNILSYIETYFLTIYEIEGLPMVPTLWLAHTFQASLPSEISCPKNKNLIFLFLYFYYKF